MLFWPNGDGVGSRIRKGDGRIFWSQNMKEEVRLRNHLLNCSHSGGGTFIKCVGREEEMDGSKQKLDGD